MAEQSVKLQLGDVIEILSPSDGDLDEKQFLIRYIDSNVMKLLGKDGQMVEVFINDDGSLRNESIEEIVLLSRAEEPGYARQNGLLPGEWINVFFGGDVPAVITGKITSLEEDQIEINLLDRDETIYLDFAYKGVPSELPIEKIVVREAPSAAQAESKPEAEEVAAVPGKDGEDAVEVLDAEQDEDVVLDVPREEEDSFKERAKTVYLQADQIQLGPALGKIVQEVEVPEEEKRYGIDKQRNDMLSELLSKIPNSQRTDEVLNHVHLMVERFDQLRSEFSQFDDAGNALMPAIQGADFKPLVNTMNDLAAKLYWILPVVKDRKRVYDVDDMEIVGEGVQDVIPSTLGETRSAEDEAFGAYRSNRIPDGQNGYAYFVKEIASFWQPFVQPASTAGVLAERPVSADVTVLADNLGDMFSSAVSRENLDRVRFLIQQYNLGFNGLERSKNRKGEVVVKTKALTQPDQAPVSSIITLPRPVVSFSHINLPASNIMTKAGLNVNFLQYWQLLRTRTSMTSKVIEDLGKPYPHEAEKFLTGVSHYIMNEDVLAANKSEGQPVYRGFLESLIPKTRVLFDLLKDSIKGRLTIQAIVSYLEPFMVYHRDLSFTQYREMNEFISRRISDFKSEYVRKKREFAGLPNKSKIKGRELVDILQPRRTLINDLMGAYGFLDDRVPRLPGEVARLMSAIDYGRVYNNAVAVASMDLMASDGLEAIETSRMKLAEEASREKNDAKCERVLAKKYLELDELTADDGKDIYFDKRYDPTFYDIAKGYEGELGAIEDKRDRIQYLARKLMETNGLSEENALRDAEAMIEGRRVVKDGDYAILAFEDAGTANYYKRQAGVWVKDESMDENKFTESSRDFCNLTSACLEVNAQCLSFNKAATEIAKDTLDSAIKEFDIDIAASAQDIARIVNAELDMSVKRGGQLEYMHARSGLKYDLMRYKLGQDAAEVVGEESPAAPLRDLILAQGDFVKRQNDIQRFVDGYCRMANPDEDENWLYCSQTNTKLLPSFYPMLAYVFLTGGDYLFYLRKIATERGIVSIDGAAIVDKHSGYVIMMQEADTDEGYTEEGFRMQTRAVMEADLGDAVVGQAPAKKQAYDTPEAEMTSNVVSAMARFMGLSLSADIKESIVSDSVKLLAIADKSLKAGAQKSKKAADNYETSFDKTLVVIALSYFLVYVQTAIPSLKTKKTHPGCKRSFAGYPTFGAGGESGLEYLVCIAHDLKSPVKPWSGINKVGKKSLLANIKAMTDAFILKSDDIKRKIAAKIEYAAIEETEAYPEDLKIQNWVNFLPPLRPVKVGAVEGLSEQFSQSLVESLKKGSPNQTALIDALRAKLIYVSLAVEESIQKVVRANVAQHQAILANSSNEPYLENACCDEAGMSTKDYFVSKQPAIKTDNKLIRAVGNILQDVGAMGRASFLFDPEDTRRYFPSLPNDFSEETIYRAFIEFCRFNFDLPLGDDLQAVCMTKPDGYDPRDPIEEKIRKLKRDGRNYDNESLQQLLAIINRGNIVKLRFKITAISNIQRIRDLLESLDAMNSNAVPAAFREKFEAMIDTYEIGGLSEDTSEMRAMKNYLAAANTRMMADLNMFIERNVQRGDARKFAACLNDLLDFPMTGQGITLETEDETVFRTVQFSQNAIDQLGRVLPTIILNGVDYSSVRPPTHWKLSQRHAMDFAEIIRRHYEPLARFYKDDVLHRALSVFRNSVKDVILLAKETVFYAPIKMDGKYRYSVFDRRLTTLLMKYYLLTVLTELSQTANDDSVLRGANATVGEREARTLFTQQEVAELDNGLLDQRVEGERRQLETQLATSIVALMQVVCGEKEAINFNYQTLMERVLRAKEKEKEMITDYLKEMTDEEREVEDIFKAQKLGKWGVGEQKGFRVYQAATYDQERLDMDDQIAKEMRLGKQDAVTAMNMDIFRYDMDMADANAAAIEAEEYDMRHIGEDNDGAGEEYDDNDGY
jgi:hypothetical protein